MTHTVLAVCRNGLYGEAVGTLYIQVSHSLHRCRQHWLNDHQD